MGGKTNIDLAERYNIYFPNTKEKEHLEFWQEICIQENLQIPIGTIKDLKNIPHDIISKTINFYNKGREVQNIEEWEKEVAPFPTIIIDINATLNEDIIMFLPKQAREALTIRAIAGHAQNGHATFKTEGKNGILAPLIYANTTIEDVIEAIERNPPQGLEYITKAGFKRQSQTSIDNIVYPLEGFLKDMKKNIANLSRVSRVRKLIDRNGNPINGVEFLRNMHFDMFERLRGFDVTTSMDDFKKTRTPIFNKYGHQMGGGSCHLIKTENLKKYNLGLKDLSSTEYKGIFKILKHTTQATRIEVFNDLEITKEKDLPLEDITAEGMSWDRLKEHPSVTDLIKNPDYCGQFIREVKGKGVSDDLLIWYSGLLSPSIYKTGHQISKWALESRMLGARDGDDIDTSEKYATKFFPGGQDGTARKYLEGLFAELATDERIRDYLNLREQPNGRYYFVDKNEIEDLTLLGGNREIDIHSSARHLIKNRNGTCATIEYLKQMYFHAKDNHMRMNIKNIYDIIGDRLNKDASEVELTCKNIPFRKIREKMIKGAEILKTPSKREEKLRQYIFAN